MDLLSEFLMEKVRVCTKEINKQRGRFRPTGNQIHSGELDREGGPDVSLLGSADD